MLFALPSAFGITEINKDWVLDSDWQGSLRIQGNGEAGVRSPIINLQGHKLTLDAGGIEVGHHTNAATLYSGTVTSSTSFLTIRSLGTTDINAPGSLYIDSNIADSNRSVGVQFFGGGGILVFEGRQSNTFTGNVEVAGLHNSLFLNKIDGAVAVQRDILINQGRLVFHRSQQLQKTSKVKLKNGASLVYRSLANYAISNTFKELSIEKGGVIEFDHIIENTRDVNSNKYHIYLDDLVISGSGLLTVKGWETGRDFLLVRKNSRNLKAALEKVRIEGWAENQVYLTNYDKDYWSIEAAPEPTTYGAIVTLIGLGSFMWRRNAAAKNEPPNKTTRSRGAASLRLWTWQRRRKQHSHS